MNTNQFKWFWVWQVKKNQNLRELYAIIKWLRILNIRGVLISPYPGPTEKNN